LKQPINLLSEVGKAELNTAIASRANGGHERTKRHLERVQFIRNHREHWNDPNELARIMKARGLYSPKTDTSQISWAIQGMVDSQSAKSDGAML
jgi:hypothetical protein